MTPIVRNHFIMLRRLRRNSHDDWRLRIHLQGGDKRFLRDVDLAELAHLLLAGFLLLEQLALAGGVAAVALGGDVLAQRPDRLPGDDLPPDRPLARDLQHVRPNKCPPPPHPPSPPPPP